jgi:hypothetical protein
VDAGPGRSIKYWMSLALDAELEDPGFLGKWTDGKFSASERRILMTKWAGDAFERLTASRRNERYFTKTGCLLRVDGQPNAINLQGMPNYSFPHVDATRLVISFDTSEDEDAVEDDGESNFDESGEEDCDVEWDNRNDDGDEAEITVDDKVFEEGTFVEEERTVAGGMILPNPVVDGEVMIVEGKRTVAAGTVHPNRRILHGCNIAPTDVVVFLTDVFAMGNFGEDPFGEPIGKGSYVSVNRNSIKKKN